jgi:hypothetical protein
MANDCTSTGFSYDTLSGARKALKVAKAALAAYKANRKQEPWEAQALAAGWKPPKEQRK